MANPDLFQHGSIVYPLPAATTNPLVADADPTLSTILAFFSYILDKYLGARLKAQAALHGINIAHAVMRTIAVEPTPDILAENFQFPLLAVWRVKDADNGFTLTWNNDAGEMRFAYVLPLLTAKQKVELLPILRSVGRTLAYAFREGWDPGFRSGQQVWKAAGVQQLVVREMRYGALEALNQEAPAYRALIGTFEMFEREGFAPGTNDPFGGADLEVDAVDRDGNATPVANVATGPKPTVTNVIPSTGSKAGGTTVTVKGTNFHPGQPARVLFSGREAKSVVVLDATTIRCVTPAIDAIPTLLAAVSVINFDGQTGRLPASFTFTTP